MTESLDDILSGRGEAVSQTPAVENVTQAPEGKTQPEPQTDPDEAAAVDVNGQKMVPHQALHAQKEKVKRYTEQVAEFEKSIGSVRDQNAALTRQVTELLQRIPQPKQEQQARPDFFENPEAATRAAAQDYVDPHLNQITQTLMANAQIVAGMKYGDDKVQEAEQAFLSAMQTQALEPVDYHKVVNSPNRYAEAVKWHQRQQAQKEIGDDPAAFRVKVEAEILAKHGLAPETSGQQSPVQQRAPVMPTNLATARNVGQRTGPAWSGPPEIADIFNRKRSPA